MLSGVSLSTKPAIHKRLAAMLPEFQWRRANRGQRLFDRRDFIESDTGAIMVLEQNRR